MLWGTVRNHCRSLESCRTSQTLRQTRARPKIPSRWFNLLICHYSLYSCCQLPLLLKDPCKSLYCSTESLAMDLPKPSEGEDSISSVCYPTCSTSWACSSCFLDNWSLMILQIRQLRLWQGRWLTALLKWWEWDWPQHPHLVPWDQ